MTVRKGATMGRKLFCEISPTTYKISVFKNKVKRIFIRQLDAKVYTTTKTNENLSEVTYVHKSLMRRTLGGVNAELQENKAINLSIAVPKIDGVIISPGETFSFWKLVGSCSKSKGYLNGLMIKGGKVNVGIGGGMCQLSNLIHWMVLHSPLDIVEHHHHHQIDMFPDYKRQIPFGTGTSIMHNYLDYQFTNNTKTTFQIRVCVDETHLMGELRAENTLKQSYHIVEEDQYFEKKEDAYYRNNKIYKRTIDKSTGNEVAKILIISNHSKVVYDKQFIPKDMIK